MLVLVPERPTLNSTNPPSADVAEAMSAKPEAVSVIVPAPVLVVPLADAERVKVSAPSNTLSATARVRT